MSGKVILYWLGFAGIYNQGFTRVSVGKTPDVVVTERRDGRDGEHQMSPYMLGKCA